MELQAFDLDTIKAAESGEEDSLGSNPRLPAENSFTLSQDSADFKQMDKIKAEKMKAKRTYLTQLKL